MDWDELRSQYAPLIWNTVSRVLKDDNDARDCSQEVLIEAFHRFGKRPVENPVAWIRWLATRRAIDLLRKRKRRLSRESPIESANGSMHPVQDELECQELLDRVREELGRIPRKQAESFWLICVEQESREATANVLGVTENGLAVLLHRARTHLRRRLEAEYMEYRKTKELE